MRRAVFLILALMLVLLIAPIAFLAAAMEPTPIVTQRLASTPQDAARTKQILYEIRALTETNASRHIRISEADINSIIAFGARAVPALRGEARITSNAVWLKLSADIRRVPGGGWLNLQTLIRPSETELELGAVRLGSFNLPASIMLPALRHALDFALGDDFGHMAVDAVSSLSIQDKTALVGIGLDAEQRQALAQRTTQTVRSVIGVSSPEQVGRYRLALDNAVKAGQLSGTGSVLPFLRFAMEHAHKRAAEGNAQEEIKAGLLALTIYCGHAKFQTIIGDTASGKGPAQKTVCGTTTLRGRGDLRQHFTISAGLKAAGDAKVAFAIGEFKELLDSNQGGSGFSFDDLAADRAGIRFAEAFLNATPEQREGMLSRMVSEGALVPRVDDLASGLSQQEFKRRFGDVNSTAYKEMVAKIDGRINRLDVFALP